MKAVRVKEFGGPEVMQIEEIERPAAGPGEALVEVAAAGVGPWDAWVRAGRSVLPQPLPLTPGSDLSGTVVAVGPGVTHVAAGDSVYGTTNPRFVGAYAEYAVCTAGMIAAKPKSIDHVAAASIPVVAVTAWQALFDRAKLEAGNVVLIHGAAGSVGAYAVQLAHRAGIRVLATASGEGVALARSLGADVVLDYRATRFEDGLEPVDAVIDLVGGETQTRSFAVLRRGGRLVSAVSKPDAELARARGVEAEFFLVGVTTARLNDIAAMVDAGDLVTRVGRVLPLGEAVTAHEMLDGLRPRPSGKIVLAVR